VALPLDTDFIYTTHARQRMVERKITTEQVQAVVFAPDDWYHGEDDEIIATKRISNRVVMVVYLSLPGSVKVITVMLE
jgi:hypothetical protein